MFACLHSTHVHASPPHFLRLACSHLCAFPVLVLFRRGARPVTDFARQVYTDPAINVEFQLLTAQLSEM